MKVLTDNDHLLLTVGLLEHVCNAIAGRTDVLDYAGPDGERWTEDYNPWDRLTDDLWVRFITTLDKGQMSYRYFMGQVRRARTDYMNGVRDAYDKLRVLRQTLTVPSNQGDGEGDRSGGDGRRVSGL